VLKRRPSWWANNGGPYVLLAAVILVALMTLALRLTIGPLGPPGAGVPIEMVTVETTAILLVLRARTRQSQQVVASPGQ
jgi:hypothetical protein